VGLQKVTNFWISNAFIFVPRDKDGQEVGTPQAWLQEDYWRISHEPKLEEEDKMVRIIGTPGRANTSGGVPKSCAG
jgi:hypothetical protein